MDEASEKHDLSELIEPRHHRAEIVFGIASFAVALFLLTQISSETTWIKGQPWAKQPAFVPVVSIVGMTLFGTLELWFSWRRNASGRGDSIAGEVLGWIRTIEYAAWFMAYVYLVPIGGYLPVTWLFCAVLTWRLGYRNWRMIVAALATGTATVILFKSLLSVRIPGGAVYEYLPATLRNFMILYL